MNEDDQRKPENVIKAAMCFAIIVIVFCCAGLIGTDEGISRVRIRPERSMRRN